MIVVTGAARGLGKAYATTLAQNRAIVVLNDIPGSEVESVAEGLRASGAQALASVHSVASPEEGAAIVEETLGRYGRIDGLVNNAGILRNAPFAKLSADELLGVLAVNLHGVLNVGRPAFRAMQEAGYGRILNVSSASVFGYAGFSAYAASKGAVLALTGTMAQEGSQAGIKVNALFPAATTPMADSFHTSKKKPDASELDAARARMTARFHPEGVAELVAVLMSEACTVTNEAFSAIAGRYARVSFAVANGWLAEDDEMRADRIFAHFDQVRDMSGALIPENTQSEIMAVSRRMLELRGN
ncbi:SDR family NAD(P)-dependent oxidoreductase [Caballeronia sp. AZ7_KS35]|uniref:SDR family NAD(P)-dependent oxidoreductase n=1 Tax=Caballeronia sp. AZ7_KS35 TaxID=2921762 RepID=UPI002027BE3F